jgi:hypothetical protein
MIPREHLHRLSTANKYVYAYLTYGSKKQIHYCPEIFSDWIGLSEEKARSVLLEIVADDVSDGTYEGQYDEVLQWDGAPHLGKEEINMKLRMRDLDLKTEDGWDTHYEWVVANCECIKCQPELTDRHKACKNWCWLRALPSDMSWEEYHEYIDDTEAIRQGRNLDEQGDIINEEE